MKYDKKIVEEKTEKYSKQTHTMFHFVYLCLTLMADYCKLFGNTRRISNGKRVRSSGVLTQTYFETSTISTCLLTGFLLRTVRILACLYGA